MSKASLCSLGGGAHWTGFLTRMLIGLGLMEVAGGRGDFLEMSVSLGPSPLPCQLWVKDGSHLEVWLKTPRSHKITRVSWSQSHSPQGEPPPLPALGGRLHPPRCNLRP